MPTGGLTAWEESAPSLQGQHLPCTITSYVHTAEKTAGLENSQVMSLGICKHTQCGNPATLYPGGKTLPRNMCVACSNKTLSVTNEQPPRLLRLVFANSLSSSTSLFVKRGSGAFTMAGPRPAMLSGCGRHAAGRLRPLGSLFQRGQSAGGNTQVTSLSRFSLRTREDNLHLSPLSWHRYKLPATVSLDLHVHQSCLLAGLQAPP